MSLFDEYLKRGRRNFEHDRSSSEQSIRERRVRRFLAFCESNNVKNIRLVQQADYDGFINQLHESGASIWTLYKYKLAIHEFAARWRLPLRVKPNRGQMLSKKKMKIEQALQKVSWLSPDQRDELIDIIMRVL